MRAMRRNVALVGLILSMVLMLAGCMHMDRTVDLKSDGSGSYTLSMGFSEQLVSLASAQLSSSMDQFGARVKQKGGSYRHYDDTGYSYWAFTRPFTSVADLNKLLQEQPQSSGSDTTSAGLLTSQNPDTLTFSEQSGMLSNTFHVTGHMSLVLPSASSGDSSGVDMSSLLKDMRESFAVTMPGSITAHKGGVISGNTVTYTVHYGEQTDIDVTGGGLNTALLLPIGGGVLVMVALVGGGVVFWRMRRKRAEQPMPAFVGAAHDAPTVADLSVSPAPSMGDAPTLD